MRVDKKRLREIDEELEMLKAAMAEATKKGDWRTYDALQERYNKFLQMQVELGGEKKDKATNRISIAKIIVDLLGTLVTAGLGIFAVLGAVGADNKDIIVNNRSWNVAMDALKRKKGG